MRRLWWLGIGAGVMAIIAFVLARSGVIASDFWRDFVGLLSLFLTLLGLGYTVYQVTLIESAARVAAVAAKQAHEESRRRLFQFTVASVHRLIDAVASDLERKEWGKAVIRLNDLADQAAQIGAQQLEWTQLVRGLRDIAEECLALENERRKKAKHEKWNELLMELRTRLDAHFGPLQN
jgi:hypothetical protein